MYHLMEENKDLKEDLERLRNMTYEQKVKDITKTNKDLMKRNGTLLIEYESAKQKMIELERQLSEAQGGDVKATPVKKTEGLQRP